VCRLRRARFSTGGTGGAVVVLHGGGGCGPLAAVAVAGGSTARRTRLSATGEGDAEGLPGPGWWWSIELERRGSWTAGGCCLVPTSLAREASIWAAASRLCCGTRGPASAVGARWRVGDGDGGSEVFGVVWPFGLDGAWSEEVRVGLGRGGCLRLDWEERGVGRGRAVGVGAGSPTPTLARLAIAVTESLRPSVVVCCNTRYDEHHDEHHARTHARTHARARKRTARTCITPNGITNSFSGFSHRVSPESVW
jgi:hypothetical protein